MSSDRLLGRRAVVTGAAAGIGRAIAEGLLAAGAEVIALDRFWPGDVNASWLSAGGMAETVDIGATDMSRYGSRLISDYGPIDLIVNNVGITTSHRFLDLDEEHFDFVMAVNLRGPWFLTQALVRYLYENQCRGSVLFISSVHDRRVRWHPHYAASKAAIVATVRELAHELAPLIRVNAISPGWIDSSSPGSQDAPEHELYERLVPLGRRGRPVDITPTALHLLDDAASPYTTGVTVPVDGGLLLHTWLDDLGQTYVMRPTETLAHPAAALTGNELPPVRHLLLDTRRTVEELYVNRVSDGAPLALGDVMAELARRFDLSRLEVLGYPEHALLVREALRGSDYALASDEQIVRGDGMPAS